MDNGFENLFTVPPAVSYIPKFAQLRSTYVKMVKDALVPKNSASTGWAMQVAHPTYAEPAPQECIVVTDNFHTRLLLGVQIRELTGDETAMMVMVRLNNMKAQNKIVKKDALKQLEVEDRGYWCIFQAHIRQGKGRDVLVQTFPYAGSVVWKNRTVAILFSKDLQYTPSAPVMVPDAHAIKFVHSLTNMRRWLGTEFLHPTFVEVPAIVMAFNHFMKVINRFDQRRVTNTTARKEQLVPISVFTFLLDPSIQNRYAVYKSIRTEDEALIPLRQIKRRIAETLVAPKPTQRATKISVEVQDVDGLVIHSSVLSMHMLMRNNEGYRTRFYLCRLRGY